MDHYPSVIALFVLGIALIGASFVGVPAGEKWHEHFSRTLANVGVALLGFGVAIGAYYLKDNTDLDHERKTAALNFVKSMLQFGTSTNHMQYIRESCYLDYSEEKCQERVTLATRLPGLLPSIDVTFGQVARGSQALGITNRLSTRLIENEIGLKVRLPTVVPYDVRKMGGPSAQRRKATDAFLANIQDFESVSHQMSAIFCMFAAEADKSWEAFDETVKKLEEIIGTPEDTAGVPREQVEHAKLMHVLDKAKGMRAANVDCTDVPTAVREKLLFGGGDGGGGGSN